MMAVTFLPKPFSQYETLSECEEVVKTWLGENYTTELDKDKKGNRVISLVDKVEFGYGIKGVPYLDILCTGGFCLHELTELEALVNANGLRVFVQDGKLLVRLWLQ